MDLPEFLEDCAAQGVVFSLDGDRLRCHIPKGVPRAQITAAVAGNKQEIIRLLQRERRRAPALHAEQTAITGEVALTPIQRWFFGHNFANPHHWNQCVLLELERPTGLTEVLAVFDALLRHHDALRFRYHWDRGAGSWSQNGIAAQADVPVSSVDLTGRDAGASDVQLEGHCVDAQATLNLTGGPLLKAILFNNPEAGGRQRLFVVVHHLVVDGVSWRILLEDISTALTQIARGEPIALPPKSTSYQYWAEQLLRYAQSAPVQQEVAHWSSRPWHAVEPLPRDFDGVPDSDNTVLWEETVSLSFSAEETGRVLRDANAMHHSHADELLVAALADAYRKWAKQSHLLLGLEGHGRELFQPDLDLSRTVGWFTTLFCVVLDTGRAGDTAGLIQHTKQVLRQIPNKGLGFGLLYYVARQLVICSLPTPEIIFNYLGQFALPGAATTPIRACAGPTGRSRSELGRRTEIIAINALVVRGVLEVGFCFSTRLHRRESIVRFAEDFRSSLLAITTAAVPGAANIAIPSDFPLVEITQRQLDELHSGLGALDDVWPLTSTQAGFLYSSLAASDKPYVEQVVFELKGSYDTALLEQAWHLLQERHPILRGTVQFLDDRPALMVMRNGAPGSRFSCTDWRRRPDRSRGVVLEQARAIRHTGFDLLAEPANRMDLILLDDSRLAAIWTFHHLLLDGWSNARVLEDWRALAEGAPLAALAPVVSFSAYLYWLRRQDKQAAIAYWVDYLGPLQDVRSIGTKDRRTQRQERATCKLSDVFSAELSQRIRELARKRGASLNAMVQVAWGIVLRAYTEAERVVFGKTVSGRSAELADSTRIVGTLVNTVPVCIDFSAAQDVWQLIDIVQRREARGHGYEYVSAAEIQRGLGFRSDTQLFESILVFQNYPLGKPHVGSTGAGALDIELVSVPGGESPYLFTVLFAPGATFSVDVIFDEARIAVRYASGVIERLCRVITEMGGGCRSLSELVAGIAVRDRPVITELVPETRPEPAPPLDSVEAKLLQIWKQTLHVQDMGIDHNFFEMGGHSLVAVELIGNMNLAALRCSMRDLTAAPSVRKLAERIRPRLNSESQPHREPILHAPLLPIQRQAIEGFALSDRTANPGVPAVFALSPRIDETALIQTLDVWYGHDIFRLRFFEDAGEWQQGPERTVMRPYAPIRRFALDSDNNLLHELTERCLQLEQTLDVRSGPTIQLGLVTVQGRLQYLIWSIDHLVSDFITGSLLLTSLRLLYRQISRGEPVDLPEDRVLYMWSKHLADTAGAAPIVQELDFWANHFNVEPSPVAEGCPGDAVRISLDAVATRFTPSETSLNLDRLLVEHRLSFEDFCLGLFLWAHRSCFRETHVLLRMICNGRDGVFEAADLTCGAGWFSIRYPARFVLGELREPLPFVLDMAAQHAHYRVNRQNYGILRYNNAQTAPQLSAGERWSGSIPFNCWGETIGNETHGDILTCQLSNDVLQEILRKKRAARAARGFDSSDDPTRGMLFYMSEGRLCAQYSFNSARTDGEKIDRLLDQIAGGFTQITQPYMSRSSEDRRW